MAGFICLAGYSILNKTISFFIEIKRKTLTLLAVAQASFFKKKIVKSLNNFKVRDSVKLNCLRQKFKLFKHDNFKYEFNLNFNFILNNFKFEFNSVSRVSNRHQDN